MPSLTQFNDPTTQIAYITHKKDFKHANRDLRSETLKYTVIYILYLRGIVRSQHIVSGQLMKKVRVE